MTENLSPGDVVRNPEAPAWGLGRVQSVLGNRITVNFEECGRLVIDRTHVTLEIVRGEAAAPGAGFSAWSDARSND